MNSILKVHTPTAPLDELHPIPLPSKYIFIDITSSWSPGEYIFNENTKPEVYVDKTFFIRPQIDEKHWWGGGQKCGQIHRATKVRMLIYSMSLFRTPNLIYFDKESFCRPSRIADKVSKNALGAKNVTQHSIILICYSGHQTQHLLTKNFL